MEGFTAGGHREEYKFENYSYKGAPKFVSGL